jgi:hypothetical protein
MPLVLYPWGTSPQYSLPKRLAESQSQSGYYGEEKKHFPLCQESNPLSLAVRSIAYSLYHLMYPGSHKVLNAIQNILTDLPGFLSLNDPYTSLQLPNTKCLYSHSIFLNLNKTASQKNNSL